MLDLRWPMGLMFAIVGAMLAVFGIFTNSSPMYQEHSLGINVNLWWGLALLAFGLVILGLARWAAAAEKSRERK
jgi:ABC-type Fe3+-siderophore transport system permease subunit